jgi:hypothetical protein
MSPPATAVPPSIPLRRATLADAAALARQMVDDTAFAKLLQWPWHTEALWRQHLEKMAAGGETADLRLAQPQWPRLERTVFVDNARAHPPKARGLPAGEPA